MKRHLPACLCAFTLLCFSTKPLYSQLGFNQLSNSGLKASSMNPITSSLPPEDPRSTNFLFKFGLNSGVVLRDEYSYMLGMNFSLEKSISKSVSATFSAGLDFYNLDSELEVEGVFYNPYKLGAKFWLGNSVYLHPEAGFAFGMSDYVDPLVFGASLGKTFKNGMSLGLRYEAIRSVSYDAPYYPDPSYVGLEVDFPFSPGSLLFKNVNINASPPENTGRKRSYLFMEFVGAGAFVSVQYDQRFNRDRNDGLGFRAGLGYFPQIVSLPLGINYLVGKRRSSLELGLGLTSFYNGDPDEPTYYNPNPEYGFVPLFTAGYRLQSYNGFMFRVNNSVSYENKELFPLIPGLSVGYRIR